LAKRVGREIGAKNLADAERQAYFATVKHLAEMAQAAGDLDAAIENYHLYAESERSGLETLRTLADLYERRGDPLMALRVTEQALLYNPRDKDLLVRKDKYYYSVMPDDLRARLDVVGGGFDFDYCLRRTRTILDGTSRATTRRRGTRRASCWATCTWRRAGRTWRWRACRSSARAPRAAPARCSSSAKPTNSSANGARP